LILKRVSVLKRALLLKRVSVLKRALLLKRVSVLKKRKFLHDFYIKARELGNSDCASVEMQGDLIFTAVKITLGLC
jgi:hypothetical protein